jgi:hypothetical protein
MALVPESKAEKQRAYEHRFAKWAKREPELARSFDEKGKHHPMLQPHQFNVYWSHSKDDLKEGRLEQGVSNVTVLGGRGLEGNIRARRTAEQMVAARGKEPTRTEWVP